MRTDTIKKIAIAAGVLAVIVLIVVMLSQLDNIFSNHIDNSGDNALDSWNKMNTVTIGDEEYQHKKHIKTFLVMGIDEFGKVESSGSYNNTAQADFIMLVVVNDDTKSYSVIHLNRDTMTLVDQLGVLGNKVGEEVQQLALAHTYGNGLESSCENTARAVSKLLYGAKIDYYISMNMDAISKITDYIGGVPVTVGEDLTVIDARLYEGANVTLTGDLALDFIRERSSLTDSTNISRMERQKIFMRAFVQTIKNQDINTAYLEGLYNSISDYTVANDIEGLYSFIEKVNSYDFLELVSPAGEAKVGAEFMEFYVNDTDLQRIAKELLYDKKN